MNKFAQEIFDYDGPLDIEGAWRLSAKADRRLQQAYGHTPPGGWSDFMPLLSGTPMIKPTKGGPFKRMERVEVDTTMLLESFTKMLVPPQVAAGLFILIGIHPAWGLRLAQRAHRKHESHLGDNVESVARSREYELFDPKIHELLREGLEKTIQTIVDFMAGLDNEQHSFDELVEVVEQAAESAREHIEGNYEDKGGIDPLDEGATSNIYRTRNFVVMDLVSGVFVPAGAVKVELKTFRVIDDAFSNVEVSL